MTDPPGKLAPGWPPPVEEHSVKQKLAAGALPEGELFALLVEDELDLLELDELLLDELTLELELELAAVDDEFELEEAELIELEDEVPLGGVDTVPAAASFDEPPPQADTANRTDIEPSNRRDFM